MLRLTLRNLAANKGRFAMTTLAVVLGVGFVVASFVLSDGLRSSFGDLADEITDGTDLAVRADTTFGEDQPIAESVVDEVAATEGVRVAAPYIESTENAMLPVLPDGSTISTSGPPQITFSWIDDPDVGSFSLVAGEAPDEPGEFTIDVDAAADHGFVIGQTYDMVTPVGVEEGMELVGTTSFGEDNDTVGATLLHVSLDEAQRLFDRTGAVDQVLVAVDETSTPEQVAARLSASLALDDPATGLEVVDQATVNAEQSAEFDEGITIIGNVLLGFAIVSLFVSIFIIYNTFAIVLGQRIREMALLRALGADSVQLRRSVIGEAILVGLVASTIGLAAGAGIAAGLTALFEAIGASLPDSPTILALRTVVLAYGLGVGVTALSAVAPARAAARTAPVAAMRSGDSGTDDDSRRRILVGGFALVAGVAAGAFALTGGVSGTLPLVLVLGAAAVLVFTGVTLASPVVARPVVRVLGAPIAGLRGTSGRLARANAMRNPRRTATTGAALMIGLSLVTTGYVVGESVKAQLGSLLESTVQADYVVVVDDDSGLPSTVVEEMDATGAFSAITDFRYDDVRLADGGITELAAADLSALDELFTLDLESGALPAEGATDVMIVHRDVASDRGLAVGDEVTIEFATGTTTSVEVVAIHDNTVLEDPLVPFAVFADAGVDGTTYWLAASLDDAVTAADAAPLIAGVEERYPQLSVDTAAEFREQFEATIDSALMVVNVLLALAVIIALIGIANTLALSVHERTREIGLLRAVGMTRSETRRMVRWEAVLVALFGASLGVTLGLVFGWGVVGALPEDSFGGTLAIPVAPIVQLVVIAVVATLVAAWLPARRAGRLDVLDAIAE